MTGINIKWAAPGVLAVTLLAAANTNPPPQNIRRGAELFTQCAACHTPKEGLGPALSGVFGRKAGSRTDYRYSAAILRSNLTWDRASLRAFLRNPQQLVRGNKMPFAGLSNDRDIDDLVAYVSTLK